MGAWAPTLSSKTVLALWNGTPSGWVDTVPSFEEKEGLLRGKRGGWPKWLAGAPTAKGSAGWFVSRFLTLRASFYFCVVHVITRIGRFLYTRDSRTPLSRRLARISPFVRVWRACSILHLVLDLSWAEEPSQASGASISVSMHLTSPT